MSGRTATHCPKCNSLQALAPKVRFHPERQGFMERYVHCGACRTDTVLEVVHVEVYKQRKKDANRAKRLARIRRRKSR